VNPTYKHTQIGYVILLSMGVGIIVVAQLPSPYAARQALAATLALIALLFGTLTVEVSAGRLHWMFGLGWFRKSVSLFDIASVEPIRTSFWWGWGIHLTPKGWLYNVSGWRAVHIRLKNGREFMLGTDEPEALIAALLPFIRQQEREHRSA